MKLRIKHAETGVVIFGMWLAASGVYIGYQREKYNDLKDRHIDAVRLINIFGKKVNEGEIYLDEFERIMVKDLQDSINR